MRESQIITCQSRHVNIVPRLQFSSMKPSEAPSKAPSNKNTTQRTQGAKKRKDPPQSHTDVSLSKKRRRAKTNDARTILTQSSDVALKNGSLNLQAFIKARDYEIRALEDSMRKSKNALAGRAFQYVPRHMRRRTAS